MQNLNQLKIKKSKQQLETALFETMRTCEQLGQISDNADDMAAPIDGNTYKDCADVCNLCIRLSLRNSERFESLLTTTQELIEHCKEDCLDLYESHADLAEHVLSAVEAFETALSAINCYVAAIELEASNRDPDIIF